MPKFNGYQSLHTTVVGPDGTGLEVQIRTKDMHERAEFGIAAHWLYKEGGSPTDVELVADLRFLQETHDHPKDFLESLKLDLYQDEVFALTPRGDVITLPRGATPVDFAYKVHTDVGHRCIGAKVNGRLVALSTAIESGDVIEVLTSNAADAHPSRDWLDFVKSSRASAKIRQWFTKERRENALADGREQVTRAVRRLSTSASRSEKDTGLKETAEDLGFRTLGALYVAVGDGRVAAGTVATRLTRLLDPEQDQSDQDLLSPPLRRGTKRPTRGIVVEGFDDMLVRIARCCAPVPGDDIVGFVTVGRGVSVHRSDCANIGALGQRAERIIEVSWAPGPERLVLRMDPGGSARPTEAIARCDFDAVGPWAPISTRPLPAQIGIGSPSSGTRSSSRIPMPCLARSTPCAVSRVSTTHTVSFHEEADARLAYLWASVAEIPPS